ncbi:MAG: hypothetical protein AMJ81_02510 [Phycisphaerae bacterium SM23_33]|nr:MAG: hypothetical protein AMJ81_02510 [Phycisphaerae bacterium SM23_33]
MRQANPAAIAGILAAVLWLGPARPAPAAVYQLDMNDAASPTWSGFAGVLRTTLYNPAPGYGWTSSPQYAQDQGGQGGLNDMLRDFHSDQDKRTFLADLSPGAYTVALYFRHDASAHDNIQVWAEGNLVLPDVDVPQATTVTQFFAISVSDGQLALDIDDPDPPGGALDADWILNGIVIVPEPAAAALLAAGFPALLRRRRKA